MTHINFPPPCPPGPAWPPPFPPLVLPRLRRLLQRMFTALERRKARHLLAEQQTILDHKWRLEYEAWWKDVGWIQGAPTVEVAYANLIRQRVSHA